MADESLSWQHFYNGNRMKEFTFEELNAMSANDLQEILMGKKEELYKTQMDKLQTVNQVLFLQKMIKENRTFPIGVTNEKTNSV